MTKRTKLKIKSNRKENSCLLYEPICLHKTLQIPKKCAHFNHYFIFSTAISCRQNHHTRLCQYGGPGFYLHSDVYLMRFLHDDFTTKRWDEHDGTVYWLLKNNNASGQPS